MLAKREHLIILFDFYGALLTEKQRLVFDLYYQDDLSLGEIAEDQNISRQAVYDILKRCEILLEEYENKLKLVNKFQSNKVKMEYALSLVDALENSSNSPKLGELKKIIRDIINDH